MAGESITFDFIGRGADALAQNFKKTGDNASLAARGAQLCADSLDKERKAADASAGASLALAKADKILADAEKELAADALAADAALKKQQASAQKSSTGLSGLLGRLGGGGAATPDTGGARAAFATLDKQLSQDAATRLRSGSTGSVLGALNAMFSRGAATKAISGGGGLAVAAKAVSGGSGGGGTTGGPGLVASTAGGIGPNILGTNLVSKGGAITGAVTAALATLPALAGIAGLGIGAALIGGAVAEVIKGNPKLQAQFKAIGTDAQAMLQKAAAPLIPAISAVLKQVPGLLKTIEPQLAGIFKTIAPQIQGIFNGLKPVITGVLGIMQAAAPAFGPVIEGLESLVANILPGIQTAIKAFLPFVGQFAGILSGLGKDIGSFFAAAAPAIGASMQVLGALLDVVGALLPIIMKLAGTIATALAPIFTQLAGVIKSLMPFLTIIGNVFAQLAGAVLGDLVSAFGALATVFTGIAPALAAFAKSLGLVFNTLENSGVFAIIGDAIEALAKPLAGLISALLNGLAPILPPLFTAIGQIAGILAGGLAAAVAAVLPPLTTLAVKVLGAIAAILPTVLPLLVSLAGVFTSVVVAVIQGVADALTKIIGAIPPGLLQGIVIGVLAIVGAMKAWAIAQAALDVLMNANPLGLIVIAVAAVVVAVTELVAHWTTVWATVKSVAADAGSFLDNLFHNSIVQDILAIWSLGLVPLATHWTTVWGDIKTTAEGFWSWLSGTFGTDIANFFTKTIPGYLTSLINGAKTAFDTLTSNISSAWSTIWTDTSNAVSTGIAAVVNFFTGLPGKIINALAALGTDMSILGAGILTDFWDGIKSIASDVTGWFSSFASGVIKVVKDILGVFSPSSVFFDIGKNLMLGLKNGILGGLNDAKNAAAAAAKSVAGAAGASSAGAPAANVAALQAAAAAKGWTGQQWTDLVNVEMREAGFSLTATNASSGAYGMAQFINGPSEYAQYGGNATTAAGQAAAMVNYIAQRYGTPAAAWAHELAYGWYDKGGLLPPGLTMALNTTGRPEQVIPHGGGGGLESKLDQVVARLDAHIALTRKLIDTTAAVPAGVGRQVGGAIGGASSAASFRSRYPRGGA